MKKIKPQIGYAIVDKDADDFVFKFCYSRKNALENKLALGSKYERKLRIAKVKITEI